MYYKTALKKGGDDGALMSSPSHDPECRLNECRAGIT